MNAQLQTIPQPQTEPIQPQPNAPNKDGFALQVESYDQETYVLLGIGADRKNNRESNDNDGRTKHSNHPLAGGPPLRSLQGWDSRMRSEPDDCPSRGMNSLFYGRSNSLVLGDDLFTSEGSCDG